MKYAIRGKKRSIGQWVIVEKLSQRSSYPQRFNCTQTKSQKNITYNQIAHKQSPPKKHHIWSNYVLGKTIFPWVFFLNVFFNFFIHMGQWRNPGGIDKWKWQKEAYKSLWAKNIMLFFWVGRGKGWGGGEGGLILHLLELLFQFTRHKATKQPTLIIWIQT